MTRREASTDVVPNGLLTFDVEDWHHANFAQLDGCVDEIRGLASSTRYAMDENIERWIGITGAADTRSTCFVLGEFAEKYPAATKKLHDAGHEIASHSYSHELIYRMTRQEFRE
ncbi:MAG: polysaccharide deacetylase family protein, partial [Actinobacteria bacterium]|nr:polysaccharide deacetylase family protein [Actinomycetota bacterium]